MEFNEFKQVYQAYITYNNEKVNIKGNLGLLKTHHKPLFKEFNIILSTLIKEIPRIKKDKNRLIEDVKSRIKDKGIREMMINFLKNIETIELWVLEDYSALSTG